MKQLEDQAAASARSAQTEKEHSLQLEKDLKFLAAELEQVKKGVGGSQTYCPKGPLRPEGSV